MAVARATVCALVCSVAMVGAARQQEPGNAKGPKKGDDVIVRGCVDGVTLRSTETAKPDGTGRVLTAVTYELRGDKTLLKRLRQEEDGRLVEVGGRLLSAVQGPERRGKKFGRTTVFVGAGTTTNPDVVPDPREERPVLEVKSYESLATHCRQ